ncbi:uncharacterized protein LOC135817193 [Sycon ciliatum]|uniref:uncharacterized protein LOC135817193 n=1 Tax=Sycon ciliatum TaxID=27933 RepID=UPI0020A9910C|eukprot:scpid87361/ scgid34049/ 28S ribosomal protein S18a, mitochondrial; 28S ribosomal protein S18-3, mitochondrial
MSLAGSSLRTPLLRVVSEVGSLRSKVTKYLPTVYRPPPMPVTEVVVDMAETKKQFYKEKKTQKQVVISQVALDKYVDKNMKLLPETAAPFLKEKAKKGYAVKGCPLCLRNLQDFHYADILLLRQFMSPWGDPVPRMYTGVCMLTQRKLVKAIRQAQKEGLLPRKENVLKEAKNKRIHDQRHLRALLQLQALRNCGGLKEDKLAELGNVDQQIIK